MNEWLKIMLEEIDRKNQEEETDRKEGEKWAKLKAQPRKHNSRKSTRNNE